MCVDKCRKEWCYSALTVADSKVYVRSAALRLYELVSSCMLPEVVDIAEVWQADVLNLDSSWLLLSIGGALH